MFAVEGMWRALKTAELTVSRNSIAFRISALASILLMVVPRGIASGPAQPSPNVEYIFHSLIPLGSESFSVQPWNSTLTVLASAENPQFNGWRREAVGDRRRLVDAGGQPVRFFPGHVEFRVSVGTRTRIADAQPFPLRSTLEENEYLRNLTFRIKVFHGLHQTTIRPESVAVIGVPLDIPYDERIYRVSFDLEHVSTEDRVVLEVLTPAGDRLCKFHLDLI